MLFLRNYVIEVGFGIGSELMTEGSFVIIVFGKFLAQSFFPLSTFMPVLLCINDQYLSQISYT